MKKQFLLIDGENFVHALVHSLKKKRAITSRSQLHRIQCNLLFQELGLRAATVRYYTTKLQLKSGPKELAPTLQRMRKWNDRWPYLANQGMAFIKAGILRARDAKQCRKCGHKGYALVEKGVDVRLAVDIVTLGERGNTLYILSSDTDLSASLQVARRQGAEIIYVTFEDQRINAIARQADNTVAITNKQILKAFQGTE